MSYLECPYCKKDVVKLWELFFLSPFWLHRICRHCEKKIYFNFNTIKLIVYSLLIAIVLLNIIDRVFTINLGLFGVGIIILSIFLPFIFGNSLFMKKK